MNIKGAVKGFSVNSKSEQLLVGSGKYAEAKEARIQQEGNFWHIEVKAETRHPLVTGTFIFVFYVNCEVISEIEDFAGCYLYVSEPGIVLFSPKKPAMDSIVQPVTHREKPPRKKRFFLF